MKMSFGCATHNNGMLNLINAEEFLNFQVIANNKEQLKYEKCVATIIAIHHLFFVCENKF